MNHRHSFFVVALLLIGSLTAAEPAAPKKPGVLDIVPADALGAVGIRDVNELIKRGDVLIDKGEFKVPFRLSEGYKFVLGFVGISDGDDPEGAAALMMIRLKDDKVEEFKGLVLAVPVADFGRIADSLKVRREDLQEGKVLDRKAGGDKTVSDIRYVSVRGQHLLLGMSEQHVAAAATGKPLRAVLSAADAARNADDDILLYGNSQRARDAWGVDLRELEKELDKVAPDEAEALKQLLAAAPELQHIIAGINLDGGLGLGVSLGFQGDKSREILTRLQGDDAKASASLAGLPLGRRIAAHAARGQGEQTAALARGLLHYAMLHSPIDTQQFVSAGHRANVVGVFGEVWQRLEGSRAALYENKDAAERGQFSMIAVLDTSDAPKFIADMTSLGRFVNAAGFSLDDAAESIDAKTIAELIAQLADDDYAVRQTATTKLGLIGATALPALEKAEQSRDPEVQFRAKHLRNQINANLAGEKHELLKGYLLTRLRPQLAFFPKAEERVKRPIDVVQLRLRPDEAGAADQLRRLFGPDWNKLRLATVGKKIIVLLGSQTELLEEAIKNAAAEKKDLPAELLTDRLPKDRTAEFHLSLTRAQQLTAASGEIEPLEADPPLTSFSLQIAPQQVQVNLFAPYEEVKNVSKQLGWW